MRKSAIRLDLPRFAGGGIVLDPAFEFSFARYYTPDTVPDAKPHAAAGEGNWPRVHHDLLRLEVL
jgi:hypothetical protein